MKSKNPTVPQNSVSHDNIDIMGTINYTNRYRFYNAVATMIDEKIKLAEKMRTDGYAERPIIRINIACPDEKAYEKQSQPFFDLLKQAQQKNLIIETNILEPLCLNSWAGMILRNWSTPGFRNAYEDAYHYYYPMTYNPETRKQEFCNQKVILSPDKLFAQDLCDTIFLNNGKIKTR